MASRVSNNIIRYRAFALAIFLLLALLGFVYPRLAAKAVAESAVTAQQQNSQTQRPRRGIKVVGQAARVDYTKFSHRTREHQLACDACHKFPSKNWKEARKGTEAFPDVTEYPEHSSCINCHRRQFFARERPAPRICSVCHIQITPRYTARQPFPNLQDRESDFRVGFPHDKHVDIVGQKQPELRRDRSVQFIAAAFGHHQGPSQSEESDPKSCAVCHQTYQPQGKSDEEYLTKPPKNIGDAFWLKKGTFKTAPNNHATCFTCHSDESGIKPAPSECNTCHKLSPPLQDFRADFDPQLAATMGINDHTILSKWRKRESAGAFRHEGGMHPTLSCTACHDIAAMNTLDVKTLRVSVKSCGGAGTGCHITATSDDGGILNFEADQKRTTPAFQCSKCHIVFGKGLVPEDHLKAISTIPKS